MLSTRMCKLLKNTPKKIKAIRNLNLKRNDTNQQTRKLMAFAKSIKVTGIGLSTGAVNTLNEFIMNVDTYDYEDLTFELACISTRNESTVTALMHELIELKSCIKIAYRIHQPGQYLLDIKYRGIHIPNSPFKLEIRQSNANAKDVVAFGKGLKRYVAGSLVRFNLNLRKSGFGQISVVPTSRYCVGEIPLIYNVAESKDGYEVQYVALAKGSFFFHIKLNGKHIPGSPFLVSADEEEGIVEKVKLLFRLL